MKKLYKEPLLHFLIIGALIFVVFSIVNKEEKSMSGNKIVVSTAEIERLSSIWSKKWNRPPTETELKGLVDSYIKEEVYYREALALGLDLLHGTELPALLQSHPCNDLRPPVRVRDCPFIFMHFIHQNIEGSIHNLMDFLWVNLF